MKHAISAAVIFLAALFPAAADLGDFAEGIEGEVEAPGDDADGGRDPDRGRHRDSDGDFRFLEFFFDTFGFWFVHNAATCYGDYPYQPGNGFNRLGRAYGPRESKYGGTTGDFGAFRRSYHRLTAVGGAFLEGHDGPPSAFASARFDSRWAGILGVDLAYRYWRDDSGTLHLVEGCLSTSLFQTDILSMSALFGSFFFGGLIEYPGVMAGFSLVSYPFRPLSVECRIAGLFVGDVDIWEFEATLGLHIDRWAVVAVYDGLTGGGRTLHSLGIGTQVNF